MGAHRVQVVVLHEHVEHVHGHLLVRPRVAGPARGACRRTRHRGRRGRRAPRDGNELVVKHVTEGTVAEVVTQARHALAGVGGWGGGGGD